MSRFDALSQILRQYDAMRSEGRQIEPPPWQPTDEMPATLETSIEAPTKDRPARPLGRPKAWEEGLRDERAQQRMEESLRESHANKLLMDRIQHPSGGASFKQDEEGLTKAYADASYPGVYYDQNTRTMYVKGTVDAQDWWDDFTKIPVWGNLQDSRRYNDAERAYNDLLRRGKPVDRIVGHSLGGSVALQQQKDKAIPWSRTFGAPVVELNPTKRGTQERYRHILDPVSMLDRGASFGDIRSYPHSYAGFQGYDRAALALRARMGQ